MNAHTPGPWRFVVFIDGEDGPRPRDVQTDYASQGFHENPFIFSNGERIVGCDEYDVFMPVLNKERRAANIRLIAAAPELLAACQAFSKLYGHLWDSAEQGAGYLSPKSVEKYEQVHALIADAIAKATQP